MSPGEPRQVFALGSSGGRVRGDGEFGGGVRGEFGGEFGSSAEFGAEFGEFGEFGGVRGSSGEFGGVRGRSPNSDTAQQDRTPALPLRVVRDEKPRRNRPLAKPGRHFPPAAADIFDTR